MNEQKVDDEQEPCTEHPHGYTPLTAEHFLIHWCMLLNDPSPENPMRGELLRTVSDACEKFSKRYWTDPYIPYLLYGLIVLEQAIERGFVTVDATNPDAPIQPNLSATPRIAGLHRGAIWMSDDFDAPLDEMDPDKPI